MANLALVATGTTRVVESIFQVTGVSGEALAALVPVRLDATTGRIVNGNGATAPEAKIIGVTVRAVVAGQTVTVLRKGVMEGLNIAALDYGATVYVSDTDATLADAAGTVSVKVGIVIPAYANVSGAPDKLLLVDVAA